MKTIANIRVLATITVLTFAMYTIAAQNRNRDYRENKPVKIEKKHNNNYSYKHYNYTPNNGYTHKNRGKAVVITNTHIKHYRRLPVQTRPHLTINVPKGFAAMHIDGVKYFVNSGRFYRHIPNRGIVMVEHPRHIRVLPAGAIKVRVNGNFYYRYHNIYFKWTPFGFRVV